LKESFTVRKKESVERGSCSKNGECTVNTKKPLWQAVKQKAEITSSKKKKGTLFPEKGSSESPA